MEYKDMTAEQKYNTIVGVCLNNVMYRAYKNEGICLENFNIKNKEHLFFFEICKMARQIHENNYNITMSNNIFTRIKLWFPIRKGLPFIKKNPKDSTIINVPYELEMVHLFTREAFGEDIDFGDIYSEFYERK